MAKVLVISAVGLLTLYAPLELSRLIIQYGLELDTIIELCLMWAAYLGAITLLILAVRG